MEKRVTRMVVLLFFQPPRDIAALVKNIDAGRKGMACICFLSAAPLFFCLHPLYPQPLMPALLYVRAEINLYGLSKRLGDIVRVCGK
jgi:hypothetical protein